MNKTVKWILIGVSAIVVLLIAGKLLRGSSGKEVKVTVEKAGKRTIVETVNASGKVYPEVEVKVSPDISGEIVELTVEEGDSVKRGQVLARIYADIYSSQRDEAVARVSQSQATVANSQANLAALKAQLEQDRLAYNRNKQLYDDKVISKAELEQLEAKYQSSQAQYNAALQNIRSLQAGVQSMQTQLTAANKNLGRATITAPMSGVVSMLNVKAGERVVGTAQMAGTEMMRVADLSTMEVRVDVGENDIVKVSIGDSADVEVDAYNNRKFKGVVTQIASSTSKSGQTITSNDVTNYEVRIRLDPASYQDLVDPSKPKKFPFRPGMNANADIKTNTKTNVLSVPITAVAARVKGSDESVEDKKKEKKKKEDAEAEETSFVQTDDLEEVVFILNKEGAAEKRVIRTGIQDIEYIEVLSGIKPGEQVITAPYNAISKTLKPGTKVKVVASKEELIEKK
ncbi:efflux RND transporter periplasmic adaptor subunit [Chitinophagaceae bacterium LB-8]|uniref:Efflux RND transporter periplasmic adaptor subunit n=1 Tax=Paraflavisolibacter caeni TaxID=2982496 RepID=A0A9X3BJK6_9BACT|nr:efflux RND transporter periplasmic adaptor subunit [Paraflavisolibacter caeni]MCU7551333.1 efflux RND transporter periplasmic adaptor subunit [Paraflavisolibacter caeni]